MINYSTTYKHEGTMGVMRVNKINPSKGRTGPGFRASLVLAVATGIALLAGLSSPAHALNPIMHNSSTMSSTKWPGGWGNSAGSKYGLFTCATCHTAGTTAGNAKQIKSTISIPGGPSPSGTVVFNSWSTYGSPASHTTSTRVCEVCHSLTTYHKYGSGSSSHYDDSSQTDKDCTGCHAHNTGFKASGSCNSCHGNPPGNTSGLVSNPRVTNAMAGGVYGAHSTHAKTRKMTCEVCHKGNTMPTVSNTIQMGFYGYGGKVTSGNFTPYSSTNGYHFVSSNTGTVINTVVTNYTPANVCSNVYCHGGGNSATGKAPLGGGSNKTPDWEITDGTQKACGTCHGTTPADPPHFGSHTTHAAATGYSISCSKCHATVANGTHIRARVFARLSTGHTLIGAGATYSGFASFSSAGLAPSATYGSCASVYCHSNGRAGSARVYNSPTWGNNGLYTDCTRCHGNDISSATPMASDAHKAHASNVGISNGGRYEGLKLPCNECHNTVVNGTNRTIISKTLHVNGTKNVAFGTVASFTSTPTQSGGVCSSNYCHSTGQSPLSYVNPLSNWTTITDGTSSAKCDYCHGGIIGDTTVQASNKHLYHVPDSPGAGFPHVALTCDKCHSRTVLTGGTILNTTASGLHLNMARDARFKVVGFSNRSGVYDVGTNSCSNTYCHGNTASGSWKTGTAKNCGACHSTNNDGNMSPPHAKHYNSATLVTKTDGWTNTVNSTGNTIYIFKCGVCHNTQTQHVNGPQVSGQGDAQVVFNLPFSGYTNTVVKGGSPVANARAYYYSTSTTCSVYCHSNARPTPDKAYRSVSWSSGTVVCGSCHNYSKSAPTRDWSTKHEKHMKTYSSNSIFRCGTCHMGTVQNGTNTTILATSKRHVDGYRNVSSNAAAGNFKYVPATKTCQSAYCHSAGRSGDTRYTNQTWTSAATTCLSCHGGRNAAQGTPAKSSAGFSLSTTHSQHLGKYPAANMNCNICHAKTASDAATLATYTGVRYHVNNKRDVHFTGITYGTYTSFKSTESGSGSNTKTCVNVSCHGGKTRSAWNTTTINNDNTCVHCHGTNGTTTAIANSGDNRKFFAPGWPKNSAGTYVGGSDTDGEKTRTNAQVGAHFAHLSSVVMKKIKCNECHIVPGTPFDGGHMAQPRFSVSQTLSFDQASTAKWNAATQSTLAAFSGYTVGTAVTDPATCSSVYCHGYRLAKGDSAGSYRKPYWSYSGLTRAGTAATKCGRCHGVPPNSETSSHNGQTFPGGCVNCHAAVVDASGNIINKALHINRVNNATGGDCLGCHNAIADDAGIPGTRREVVSELGGSSTKKSHHITSGTLSKWHCIMCHAEGDTSTGGTSSVHKNGTIELRNVDSPGNPGTAGTHYWSIPNTKAAADWTNVDNFCFGCHDSVGSAGIAFNGTAVTLSPTATQQQKPFNDNLTNSYDAVARNRVIDAKTQFTTTNYSHHAVSGPKYSTAGGLPFNAATILQGGTVDDNSRLHCHDCHYYNGHATTNNEYMLQNNTGADTLHTATTYVCLKCHTSTYSGNGHEAGNGSDFVNGRSGNYNKTGISCTACHNCGGVGWGGIHGGNYRYTPGASPGWTYNSATETVSNAGTTQSTYRFMPGMNNNGYSPANWTASSSAMTCYTNPNASWGACTSHTGGKSATLTRAAGARALSY